MEFSPRSLPSPLPQNNSHAHNHEGCYQGHGPGQGKGGNRVGNPQHLDGVDLLVLNVVKHGLLPRYVAHRYGVSTRRVQQLCKFYRETGEFPVLGQPGRPPDPPLSTALREVILQAREKLHAGSTVVAQYVRKKRKLKIGNNKVHQVLLKAGMAQEDPRKRGRKKPWVRYERKHPLSAVHMDWHLSELGEQVCAVTDDSSRLILTMVESSNISTESSIELLSAAYLKFKHIRTIREVITDHGSEFYANKRDKNGNAQHRFELFCQEQGIHHILCGVKHPQTNRKLEKFFHIYDDHREEFESLEEYIHWYNCVRPHMSLDFKNLETPEQAFYKRLTPILVGNFSRMVERELNGDTMIHGRTKHETK